MCCIATTTITFNFDLELSNKSSALNVYFMSLFFAGNVTCLIRNYSIIIRMRRKYFFIIYIVTISTGIIIEKYRLSRNQAPWKNHS